jgi:rSAM/selenodomain-associated transferase 1
VEENRAAERPVVIVMAKAPRAGVAKTRLTPTLAPDDAAALAACFLQDAVFSARRVVRDVMVAYAPAEAREMMKAMLQGELLWTEQQGADLGERIETVIREASAQGFSPIVVIGADSPTLPPEFIEAAIRSLSNCEADIALGATEDGGYYLIALREPALNLFQNIEWSTPRAFEQTARNAARLGLRLKALPVWYDVDTPSDLRRLRDEFDADADASRRAPATSRWLRERGERERKSD